MTGAIARVLVLAAAVGLAIAWITGYPLLAPKLATVLGIDWITPRYRVQLFHFIPVVTDKGTMILIAGVLAAASLPVYLYARRFVRVMDIFDEQLAELLSTYAGLTASSGSTAEALLRAAKMIKPPLGTYVERMAHIYRATGDLEKAFEEAFKRAPPRVRLLARSIVAASLSGGMVHEVLSSAAVYSRESRRLMKLTQSRLSEYSFVVSLASLTYAVAAGIVQALVAGVAGGGLFGAAIDPDLLGGLYFYSLLVIVVASAIVIARVVHGYTLMASKYIITLTIASILAYLASPAVVS
ncbi:type II secretion system F family protein [Pyrodictium abyssi]|uniref:Type II secretion system protein GspF domain-containing protein n=1 Tax=Pyrodictium abyssi TaxID=54256 RepID=A0ABM8ITR5_9CREN|nr:hypothetical protein PABY_05150 [Pyrodictium abyssi]